MPDSCVDFCIKTISHLWGLKHSCCRFLVYSFCLHNPSLLSGPMSAATLCHLSWYFCDYLAPRIKPLPAQTSPLIVSNKICHIFLSFHARHRHPPVQLSSIIKWVCKEFEGFKLLQMWVCVEKNKTNVLTSNVKIIMNQDFNIKFDCFFLIYYIWFDAKDLIYNQNFVFAWRTTR